jgi:tripartite-type tricarboxylate transporter receptor subunit TctC
MDRRMFLGLGLGVTLTGTGGTKALAQSEDYPTRNVTFVCPFPAGGGTDTLVRLLAAELQDKLKRTVIVENRPGAATLLAAGAVAKAPPDGHTLLLAPVSTLAISPHTFKTLPYDPIKDFAPVGIVGSAQYALIAYPGVGADTLPGLIKLIKSKNGEMTYATPGIGTPHHLLMEMFLKMVDGKAQHVTYRGSPPALNDLVSGRISIMMADLSASIGLIQDGKLKVYGVNSPNRLKSLPDKPTIAEAGLPGFSGSAWFAVVVPAGTPRPIIEKLNSVLANYIRGPEAQDRLNALAISPITSTPQQLEAFIPSELAKWGKVVKDAGIEPQ